MARKLPNWVDSFCEWTEHLPSPLVFRRWAGIFAVAAAMERKVWTDIGRGSLYPHQYVTLVGPPGVGKSVVTSLIWELLAGLNPNLDRNGFHIASSSLTSASLIDELNEAKRNIVFSDMTSASFNSLTIVSNELGVLLPDYDPSFMNKLTDIYDVKPYSERRRTKDLNHVIAAPQIGLLAGTTPGYLTSFLPEGAWDQGFLSRMMLVFSSESLPADLFSEATTSKTMEKQLKSDLEAIAEMHGKMQWSDGAKKAINNWHMRGGPPTPEHPKLINYLSRRTSHLAKLCVAIAASQHDDLTISIEDFQLALDWFMDMEASLSDIFKAMVVGGDRMAMDECWHHFAVFYARDKGAPISESRIIEFLRNRVDAFRVPTIFEVMKKAGLFTEVDYVVGDTKVRGNWYKPAPRKRNDID